MAHSASSNHDQLLADIEAFSQQGPKLSPETAKPELHRDTLQFPDLAKPHAGAPMPPRQTANSGSAAPLPAAAASGSAAPVAASGLLARLKQQAESLQQGLEQHSLQQEAQAQHLNDAVGAAFRYLDELVKQLNIIKPDIPKEFVFPGNIVFAGMRWIEGAADFRKVATASEDRRFESASLRFRVAAEKKLVVDRQGASVEPFRKLLHDYGIAFAATEKTNERNVVESARFVFPCEIKTGFLLKADYERSRLVLRTRNIDRFGMMEFTLLPGDIRQDSLDELTKLFLGEPSRFMQMYRRSA